MHGFMGRASAALSKAAQVAEKAASAAEKAAERALDKAEKVAFEKADKTPEKTPEKVPISAFQRESIDATKPRETTSRDDTSNVSAALSSEGSNREHSATASENGGEEEEEEEEDEEEDEVEEEDVHIVQEPATVDPHQNLHAAQDLSEELGESRQEQVPSSDSGDAFDDAAQPSPAAPLSGSAVSFTTTSVAAAAGPAAAAAEHTRRSFDSSGAGQTTASPASSAARAAGIPPLRLPGVAASPPPEDGSARPRRSGESERHNSVDGAGRSQHTRAVRSPHRDPTIQRRRHRATRSGWGGLRLGIGMRDALETQSWIRMRLRLEGRSRGQEKREPRVLLRCSGERGLARGGRKDGVDGQSKQ